MRQSKAEAGGPEPSPWRGTLAGLCAMLVGIGLARFAYTPLIPPLITEGWFAPSQAAYLGAANLAGYLAGALLARRLAAVAGPTPVLRAMMVLATVAFFACAVPISYFWFFLWRFGAGLAGGALMALAAPSVLARIPARRRGLAGGIIFTGVGLGIAASGSLVPALLRLGLFETWCGLGALSLILTLLAWGGWPGEDSERSAEPAAEPTTSAPLRLRSPGLALKALFVSYGLNAAGLVPHMVFLVDYIARELDRGLDVGADYWVLFGLGAIVGPVLFGHLADRGGFRTALRLGFLVQAAAVALLALTVNPVWMAVSSTVVGAFVPGIVPLVLGRVHELIPGDDRARKAAWSGATAAFALGQAGAAYGFSFLFAETGGYVMLFVLGAGALVLALAIDLGLAAAVAARRTS
ncbi:MAG: YbfB/YjiJ family MFS transporter [Alphaproteobacteria bacterium]